MCDESRDGICCRYGSGNVQVLNTATGEELWSDNGDYGPGEQVYINLTETGEALWVANNPDGTSDPDWGQDEDTTSSNGNGDGDIGEDDIWGWLTEDIDMEEDIDFDPSLDSPEWPGAFPEASASNTIMFNLRSDDFPDETTWTWSKRTETGEFERVNEGQPNRGNTLFKTALALEPDSVYRLRIDDLLNDGTCCLYGGGWFTLTNSTASEDHAEGTVVWKMTGNGFDGTENVFIWADPEGRSHSVEYVPGEGYGLVSYDIVQEERIHIVVPERPVTSSTNRHSLMFP